MSLKLLFENKSFLDNFNKVVQEHGCVDILINNAGIADEQNIQQLVDVNVVSL